MGIFRSRAKKQEHKANAKLANMQAKALEADIEREHAEAYMRGEYSAYRLTMGEWVIVKQMRKAQEQ